MGKSNDKTTRKDFSKTKKPEALDNKIKRKKTIKAVSSLIVLGLASYLYVDSPDFFTKRIKIYRVE